MIFSHRASDARGVLIAFRESLEYKILTSKCDNNGGYIILNIQIQGYQLLVLNEIDQIIDELDVKQNTQIWGGDFNISFDLQLDTDGGNPKLKAKSITKIISIMSDHDLCDIFRTRFPSSQRLTWRQKTPLKQRKLNYFLISDQLQEQTGLIDVIPSVQSDHSTIVININGLKDGLKGRSYWKFNNSLLNDKTSVNLMKDEILISSNELRKFTDPRVKWDFLKYKIRQFAKDYTTRKAKEWKVKRVALEAKVRELESIISTNSNDLAIEEYHKCKAELEEIYNYITEGIIVRSKTDWYELGEKSTKYFLNLEKRNKAKSHIRKIYNENNEESPDSNEILAKVKEFYSNLYKKRSSKSETDCLKYLKNINIPKLSTEDMNKREGRLSKQECWDALQSFGNNKSPGNDGLSKEFCVCFFNEMNVYLIDSLNHFFQEVQLSTSQSTSHDYFD